MSEQLQEIQPGTSLIPGWAASATPPPDLTVSEWADQKRMLPETSAAAGGHWRTEKVPYLRGIMDAVHEHGVKKIAVEKAAQLGGSEALHNMLGYFIEHDPCPMLFIHPTAGNAEEWSKERLADMIRSTPALRAVVRDGRPAKGSFESESTLLLKMFPGGYLAAGGANSPNSFARRSVRVAIGDDIDRFPAVVGEEGDPLDLLTNRTRTYFNGLVIAVSTPTLKGGRIDSMYARSDQRRFFVACPCCDREDWITWNDPKHFRIVFDAESRDPETARLACPDAEHGGCGALMNEADRREMIARAAERDDNGWRPTAVAKEPGLIGFHVPALISTLGDVTLTAIVSAWLTARAGGKEALRPFINTWLAEGWEERGARVDHQSLLNRREDYGTIDDHVHVEIPAAAAALTCGVDVQENRLELQVMAWGPGAERWVIDYRVIPGKLKLQETRDSLLQSLARKYQHALGVQLPIHATCIDSGDQTDDVYDFVLAYEQRRIFATKGFGGRTGDPIVGKPSEKRRGKNPRPVRLYPVNVDDAKGEIYSALSLLQGGPGAMHFPAHLETVHEEYFAQLCAEHRETRYNKNGVATHTVWVEDRERNEALDTAVLCLAAYRLLNPNIKQLHAAIVAAAAIAPAAASTSGNQAEAAATGPPPPPVRRRVRFSAAGYLGGS